MKIPVSLFACLAVLFGFFPKATLAAEEYDVVVYGGTSAGVIAAVQAKKMGKTVVIVGPDKHIGGLSRDFYHRVWKEYDKPEAWKFQEKSECGGKGLGAMDGKNRTMWIFEPSIIEVA